MIIPILPNQKKLFYFIPFLVGYTKGGTQIQGFQSTGLNNFAYNAKVTLVHNTFVHVTAVASNVAGLQGISYSDPILVDLTPPYIVHVFDGDLSSKFNIFIIFFAYEYKIKSLSVV